MTFRDMYNLEIEWSRKVLIIEMFHFARKSRDKSWTIKATSEYFDTSIGLISENLKLAKAFRSDSMIERCKTREEALRKVNENNIEIQVNAFKRKEDSD